MPSNVIVGGTPDLYCFWGRSATWKSGDPTTDTQQPINPISDNIGITLGEELYELMRVVSNLYPEIEIDKEKDPTSLTLRCHFRDVFFLLAFFTYKTVSSPWTQASDTITADFSSDDNADANIWLVLHLPDPSGSGNHVDLFLDGGTIEAYRIVAEEQGGVFEEIDLKFAEYTTDTKAENLAAAFTDSNGIFSLWDGQKWTGDEQVLITTNTTLTVGGSDPPGLAVQSWTFEFATPHAMEYIASSRTAGITYEEGRGPWSLTINGKLKDNQSISEAKTALSSKTKQTVKMAWDTSPFEKYIQFTNAVLKTIEGIGIPNAGAPLDTTYTYEGAGSSALSLSYTISEDDDPRNYINYTGA